MASIIDDDLQAAQRQRQIDMLKEQRQKLQKQIAQLDRDLADYGVDISTIKPTPVQTCLTPPATHPDIFTRVEAMRFLKLPSERSFYRLRKQCGIEGVKAGRDYIYAREQLEVMRRIMFGIDLPMRHWKR